MSDVVQSLRQALQDFVAPELREHRVLLTALDSKIDSRTAELRSELTAMGSDLRAEIGAVRAEIGVVRTEMGGVRAEFRSELNTVKAELDSLKLTVQSGFEKLQHGLESAVLRGELSTMPELADLRSRVERIEDHLKLRQNEPGI
jgi:hypothetical protein